MLRRSVAGTRWGRGWGHQCEGYRWMRGSRPVDVQYPQFLPDQFPSTMQPTCLFPILFFRERAAALSYFSIVFTPESVTSTPETRTVFPLITFAAPRTT